MVNLKKILSSGLKFLIENRSVINCYLGDVGFIFIFIINNYLR